MPATTLPEAEEKWHRNATDGASKWVANVKEPAAFETYVNKIANFIGVDPGTVRGSAPARHWSEFAANADRYRDKFVSGVDVAYRTHKWSERYKKAFTTPA